MQFIKDNFVKQLIISFPHTKLITFLCEIDKTIYNSGMFTGNGLSPFLRLNPVRRCTNNDVLPSSFSIFASSLLLPFFRYYFFYV